MLQVSYRTGSESVGGELMSLDGALNVFCQDCGVLYLGTSASRVTKIKIDCHNIC